MGADSDEGVRVERSAFGRLADGRAVEAVTLASRAGVTARVITLGATLQALTAPDRDGAVDDVVLGYDSAREYLESGGYFGVTVGRYANRIAGGRFSLDGGSYQLDRNDGANHLHGGEQGFDRRIWRITGVEQGDAAQVELEYVSADGEGGYPGTLTATATYRLDRRGELTIEYRATTDRPTIVNLTNHSFFNLAGADAAQHALDHHLTLHATRFTPVGAGLIPTGELAPVAGTPFDFTRPWRIGERVRAAHPQLRLGRGYDHNYAIDGDPSVLRPAARLEEPATGRVLEILTTAPGAQLYSGNFLDGTAIGKSGRMYRQGDGVCLEPQTYPDAPNQPAFPSPRLDPGETYRNVIVYRFSVEGGSGRSPTR